MSSRAAWRMKFDSASVMGSGTELIDALLAEAQRFERLQEVVVVVPLLRVVLGAHVLDRLLARVGARERHVAVCVARVVIKLDEPAGIQAPRTLAAHHPSQNGCENASSSQLGKTLLNSVWNSTPVKVLGMVSAR